VGDTGLELLEPGREERFLKEDEADTRPSWMEERELEGVNLV